MLYSLTDTFITEHRIDLCYTCVFVWQGRSRDGV